MNFKVRSGLFCLALGAAFFVVWAESDETTAAVAEHFDALHTTIAQLAESDALASANIKRAVAPFKKTMSSHASVTSMMRINSKGKVVNEVVREGRPGRRFRNVSRQGWFTETARLNNYYGYLKRRDGDFELFWCFPIVLSGNRFGGALVAKIDMKRALKTVAGEIDKPFRVVYEKRVFFAHEWNKSGETATKKLDVRGTEDLKFYIHAKKAEALAASGDASGKTDGQPAQQVKQTTDAQAAAQAANAKGETKKGKGSLVGIIFVFVGLFVIGFGIAAFIGRNAKKRHEALLREIEENDKSASSNDPFQSAETVVIPVGATRGAPAGSAAPAAPAQQQSESPDYGQTQLGETLYSPESMATQVMSPPPGAGANADAATGRQAADPAIQKALKDGYEQARREMEAHFAREMEAALARRTEQVRAEVLGQAQKRVGEKMRAHARALSVQIDNLSKVVSRTGMTPQALSESLNQITGELVKIRNSFEGRGPARKGSPPRA